jgi:predicted metalloprotease with PDZ domain
VYYEYLVVKRAGLMDAKMLLSYLSNNINSVENNPGRFFQSLQQASYSTWSDGPFGTQGKEPGKSISYYEKGPLVGLLLDFEIRKSTNNTKSLDDVMRLVYDKYYKFEKEDLRKLNFSFPANKLLAYLYLNFLSTYIRLKHWTMKSIWHMLG